MGLRAVAHEHQVHKAVGAHGQVATIALTSEMVSPGQTCMFPVLMLQDHHLRARNSQAGD